MTDESFYGFPRSSKQDWIDRALQDSGFDQFEQLVLKDEFEGINIPPFFTVEDNGQWDWLENYMVNPSLLYQWDNLSFVDLDNDAPEVVAAVFGLGIDGVVVEWSGQGDLQVLLAEIEPEYVALWLKPKGKAVQVVERFLTWANARLSNKEKLKGGVLWDGYAINLKESRDSAFVETAINSIHELTKGFEHFRGLCIDFSIYHHLGLNVKREMALGLGALIEGLDVLSGKGHSPESILGNLFVHVSTGGNYFLHLAKLKALRILLKRLASMYSVAIDDKEICLFTSTSDLRREDPDIHNNMIRNTIEAMIAIQGNGDVLWVKVHSQKADPVFARRTAANISNLLRYESHFDQLGDATAGSYYLKYLMGRMIETVGDSLIALEEAGGWWKKFSEDRLGIETDKR